jgi:hypothetical protein
MAVLASNRVAAIQLSSRPGSAIFPAELAIFLAEPRGRALSSASQTRCLKFPHPLDPCCKCAMRKIHLATQHSPLERTFFLTPLFASRWGDLTPAFLYRWRQRRDLSGIVRRMMMRAFVVRNKGLLDAH